MASVPEISDPRDVFSQITPGYDISRSASPERINEPGYYGLPILKRPFWKWEIALYFFFEGVSAGTSVLCTMLRWTKQDPSGEIVRAGRYVSFATMLACPPLLIADLGRPERFHHMLRIWKKTSPMNHGAWALTGYGALSSVQVAKIWPPAWLPFGKGLLRFVQRLLPETVIDALSLPFALTMISYPGVLLSTTANPVWSRSHFLGSLFACSSISNGAAVLTLLSARSSHEGLHRKLSRIEDIATAAEAVTLGLYVKTAGKAARPLFKGRQSKLFLIGAIGLGIVAPSILRRSRSKILASVVSPLLTIAGSAALKWAITYAGQESAMDAELANRNARTVDGRPFWGPGSGADTGLAHADRTALGTHAKV